MSYSNGPSIHRTTIPPNVSHREIHSDEGHPDRHPLSRMHHAGDAQYPSAMRLDVDRSTDRGALPLALGRALPFGLCPIHSLGAARPRRSGNTANARTLAFARCVTR